MADVQRSSECGSVFLASNSQENKHYQASDLQTSDYQKIVNKLKSAQLIIDLLQKDISNLKIESSKVEEVQHENISADFRSEVCEVNSEFIKPKSKISCDELLDLDLNVNELIELLNMATRPWVRQTLLYTIRNLRKEINGKCKLLNESVEKSKKTYAEVTSNISAISDSQERQNIPTIITSQNNKRLATKLNQKTQIPVKRLHESRKSDRMKRERRHKIVLIGDSHIKGLSSELKHRLGDDYVILGFAKPNANVGELKDTIKKEVNKLTKDDVLVFWGGTNDVSKNNAAKGLSQEITYLGKNQQTNCLVITVPHRFDINSNSRENFEIGVYNRKLTKRVESLNNVVLVNSPMEREYFTIHGLHLNKRGKEKMAEKLASSIHQIMEPVKKHSEAIPMPLNETVPVQQNQEIETAQIKMKSA